MTAYKTRIFSPSDEVIEHVDVVLYLLDLKRLFGVKDRKWRHRGPIFNVAPAWLEKTTNKKDFEECI